ncbi:MAG: hypothetical protein FH751_01255 [Firmicutes bacterium]|nr:hypothetical protein [Bacillota bacterium]
MVQRVKVNLDVIEGMIFYWQSTSEREKIGESYLNDISKKKEMKYIYDDEFNEESVRKVLSSISNREVFKGDNKKESRFWNYNMWVLEDMGLTDMMIQPVKKLNLDHTVEMLNKLDGSDKYEEIEVIFVPGHFDIYKIVDNKLIINFFRVKADLYSDDVTIEDMDMVKYIEEKLKELIEK